MATKNLRKFNKENFAESEKFRTFANDDEPTVLAVDSGRIIPTLSGKDAWHFLEKAKKAEAEVERRKNIPPTLKELERDLYFEEYFLDLELREIEERKERIKRLEDKIKELKVNNGKAEEE